MTLGLPLLFNLFSLEKQTPDFSLTLSYVTYTNSVLRLIAKNCMNFPINICIYQLCRRYSSWPLVFISLFVTSTRCPKTSEQMTPGLLYMKFYINRKFEYQIFLYYFIRKQRVKNSWSIVHFWIYRCMLYQYINVNINIYQGFEETYI